MSFIIGSVIFHLNPISVRFFADIEKFEKLNDIVTKDIPLSEDKKLEDLKVISSYTKEIKYNGQKYKVYAYVFESTEMAASYFKKATGKKTKGKYNFTCSTNHYFGSEIIAFNENCIRPVEKHLLVRAKMWVYRQIAFPGGSLREAINCSLRRRRDSLVEFKGGCRFLVGAFYATGRAKRSFANSETPFCVHVPERQRLKRAIDWTDG